MFSLFSLAFLFASTFSLLLCIPQIFNSIPNITPFDLAYLPSPSVQDNYNNVGSPGNELTGLIGADSGGATFKNSFDKPVDDGNLDNVIPELLTPEAPLLAQTELNPPSIPNTPTEIRAGEDARERAERAGRLPKFDKIIVRERLREGYDDSKCNGGSWACCWEVRGVMHCGWMMEMANMDPDNCPYRACCFPNYFGQPNEYCPDPDPVVRAVKGTNAVKDAVENAGKDAIQKEGSPAEAGGGASGGVGAGVWGGGEGGAGP